MKVLRLFLALLLLGPLALPANADDVRDSDNHFGVLDFAAWDHDWNNHHEPLDKVERSAEMMQKAGIGWVRMDFLWADMEPQKGQFDFDRYDKIVEAFQKRGIRILAILQYNPLWRSDSWNAAPVTDDYIRYAQATVHHFKDRVKYWEIWNEPDQDTYWSPQDDMKSYSALLKKVYPVLKEEDPTCKILVGSLSEGIPFKLRWVYKNAGPESFDIVNIHPFIDPLGPHPKIQLHGVYIAVKKVMDEYHDGDKPIWFTEIGCPGVETPTQDNGWWMGVSPTEKQQADWVTTVYGIAFEWPGVQRVFWAFFRDTDHHFNNGVDYFGLVRNDFKPKPAYAAYKEAARSKS